jgi:hypothetical protein
MGLLSNEHFRWSVGRVDDRLYETNYQDIIPFKKKAYKMLQIMIKYHNQINDYMRE